MTNKEEIDALKKRVSELEAQKTIVVEKLVYIPQPYPVYQPYYQQPYFPYYQPTVICNGSQTYTMSNLLG